MLYSRNQVKSIGCRTSNSVHVELDTVFLIYSGDNCYCLVRRGKGRLSGYETSWSNDRNIFCGITCLHIKDGVCSTCHARGSRRGMEFRGIVVAGEVSVLCLCAHNRGLRLHASESLLNAHEAAVLH